MRRAITLSLPADLYAQARRMCEALGTSVSRVVEQLLREWIRANSSQVRLDTFASDCDVDAANDFARARRRFLLEYLRFQPHFQLRSIENALRMRPEEINYNWVIESIEMAEELLDMARSLNMQEHERVLREIVAKGEALLDKLLQSSSHQ